MVETIATYTDIVAALAVVVSLIFVGLQMRANTRATRAASASATSNATGEWYWSVGTSAEASMLLWTFITSPEKLSEAERFQGIFLLHGVVLTFQNSFFLSKQGSLDESIRGSIMAAIIAVKDTPGWRIFWQQRRAIFYPDFQDYVDGLLESKETLSEGLYANVATPPGPRD